MYRRCGYGTDTASGRLGITGPVKTAGLVFGDIGTTPIYTLTVILAHIPRAGPTVSGALSLII